MDDLYSNDPARCLHALRQLKNTVIGSNREKRSVIQQGVLSRLLKFLIDTSLPSDLQKEAMVILTSLAKGAPENADALVREGTVPVLVGGRFWRHHRQRLRQWRSDFHHV